MGTFDNGKNSGLVVADLLTMAARFLYCIGKGGPKDEPFGRDNDFIPSHTNSIDSTELVSLQQEVLTNELAKEASALAAEAKEWSEREELRLRESNSEFNESDFGTDTISTLDTLLETGNRQGEVVVPVVEYTSDSSTIPSSISTITSAGTCDSQTQDGYRISTKIRTATLAWLWRYADSPNELRLRFRELRHLPESIGVLHLCGCGLCIGTGSNKILGCCEKTHLILGDCKLNGHHQTFHNMIRLARPDDYTQLCGIIHRAQDGEGIF